MADDKKTVEEFKNTHQNYGEGSKSLEDCKEKKRSTNNGKDTQEVKNSRKEQMSIQTTTAINNGQCSRGKIHKPQ